MREKDLVQQILALARKQGYWAMKIHGSPYQSPRGLPDILLIRNGVASWIEVKIGGDEPTVLQEAIHEKLRAAGCRVTTVWTLEEAKWFLN